MRLFLTSNQKKILTAIALQIFNHQYTNNEVYGEFVKHLNIDLASVDHFKKIPFLPISFFKTHEVITKNLKQKLFSLAAEPQKQISANIMLLI
jgi:phenylacetate-coenzyme A ligase PaaK-like adenylate-forming protein